MVKTFLNPLPFLIFVRELIRFYYEELGFRSDRGDVGQHCRCVLNFGSVDHELLPRSVGERSGRDRGHEDHLEIGRGGATSTKLLLLQ